MRHLLNLSSDEMEALVEHREKLDAELEQLRENRMELEAEIEGKQDNNHKRDIHIREMGQRRRHHHPSD